MDELHAAADDQSHYEISLTAGQAFIAFVLLLLSLAAAFAFGLMIGKGQADERLVVRKETPVVSEASLIPKKTEGQIVELGVANEDFAANATDGAAATKTDTATTAAIVEEGTTTAPPGAEVATTTAADPASIPNATPAVTTTSAPAAAAAPPVLHVTTYAQLLSTSDQKTAENLAARLIDRGFTAAYVERGTTDKGPVYRVRVRFDSEADARAAEAKLKTFSKEVWITTK